MLINQSIAQGVFPAELKIAKSYTFIYSRE